MLLLFATCSAVRFPRRKLSQTLFETFGVLCIALLLVLGVLRSVPPEAFFPKQEKTLPGEDEEELPPPWWELRPPGGIDGFKRALKSSGATC
jgi:hypothetical protein